MEGNELQSVLNFQRNEWKYLIPNSRIEILIPELMRHMDLDPYSQGPSYYSIYSAYYDTADWQSFHEKIDGIERRKKFRIRTYNPIVTPSDKVFLEVKEKNKDIILKRRSKILVGDIPRLNMGAPSTSQDDVYDEWRFSIVRDAIKPRILVAYDRMAFVPRDYVNLRITLDRDVRYAMLHGRVKFNMPCKMTYFSKTHSVLEIKYSGSAPLFVQDLIRRMNIRNEAVSKFADSIISELKVLK